MKKLAMMLLGAGALGGAALVGKKVRARKRTTMTDVPDNISAVPTDVGAGAATTAPYAEIEIVGISEVDPQPITEISGDGVDPEAVAAAHARHH